MPVKNPSETGSTAQSRVETSPATGGDPREFYISRVFDAPREMVYDAWTDPRHLARWWGPHALTNPVCEMDVRTGGSYRITMRGPDGCDYPIKGVFQEVVKPARLVMTLDCSEHPVAWHDMVNPDRDKSRAPDLRAVQTVTFDEVDGKTRLTVRTRLPSAAIRDAMVKMGMTEGWSQSLERLDALAGAFRVAIGTYPDKTADGSPQLLLTRIFDAPRALVFSSWTDPERLKHWWGPKGTTWVRSTMDLKPGGMFHYCMRVPNGVELWGKFVYREIVEPGRLSFVVSFSDATGASLRHPMSATWPLEVLNTLTFIEDGGRTTLISHAVPIDATPEELQTFAAGRDGMRVGFAGTLDQLATYLSTTGHG